MTRDVDFYAPVCSRLKLLCPRYTPSPLWGISIVHAAEMAPDAAKAICDACPGIVETIADWLESLKARGGRCAFCGSGASSISENWKYLVYSIDGSPVDFESFNRYKVEQLRGVAILVGITPVCRSCRLVFDKKYLFSLPRRQSIIRYLAKINGLDFDETASRVQRAITLYKMLSLVRDWRVRLSPQLDMSEDSRLDAERLLNEMVELGFGVYGGWVWYHSDRGLHIVAEKVEREMTEILAEASKKAGTSRVGDEPWLEALAEILIDRYESEGVQVLGRELRLFLKLVAQNGVSAYILQQIVDNLGENVTPEKLLVMLESASLIGKWLFFTPSDDTPILFRHVIEELQEGSLAYKGKIPALRTEYQPGKELPVIVYTVTSLAPSYTVSVARSIRKILEKHGIDKRLVYKPDVFTLAGIYSGRTHYNPYILIY